MPYLQFTTEELSTEQWKFVVGYEPFYAVSNLGRVKRLKGFQRRQERLLRVYIHNGYPHVNICALPKKKFEAIHRLVAKAFLGPYPPLKEVNHIDHDKMNPRLSNLEYVTRKKNVEEAVANGKMHGRRNRALTAKDIPIIRKMLTDGYTATAIGQFFGVTRDAISEIKRGHNWKHIPN